MIRRPPRSTLFPYTTALPIFEEAQEELATLEARNAGKPIGDARGEMGMVADRKSTRLNSSHANISYAVFCLKKKTHPINSFALRTTTTLNFLPATITLYNHIS